MERILIKPEDTDVWTKVSKRGRRDGLIHQRPMLCFSSFWFFYNACDFHRKEFCPYRSSADTSRFHRITACDYCNLSRFRNWVGMYARCQYQVISSYDFCNDFVGQFVTLACEQKWRVSQTEYE